MPIFVAGQPRLATTVEAKSQGTDAIVSIQWLRAIAAMAVVAFHLDIAPWGASGVDLFFVVSGFIMWMTTDRRPSDPMSFYFNRLLRIAPLYWLYTTLLAVAVVAAPAAFSRLQFDWLHPLTSYLFIPKVSPTNDLIAPFLVQGWSLNYEIFFYAIFGVALLLSPGRRIVTLSAVLLGLIMLGAVFTPTGAVGRTYTDPLMAEFLAGVWIAWLWRRGRLQLNARHALFAVIAACACLVISIPFADTIKGFMRLAVWGLPAALIVIAALSLERRFQLLPTWGKLLGDASYSIYLSHTFVLSVLAKVWSVAIGPPQASWMFVLVAMITTALVGTTSYLLIEMSITRWARRPRPLHWGVAYPSNRVAT